MYNTIEKGKEILFSTNSTRNQNIYKIFFIYYSLQIPINSIFFSKTFNTIYLNYF